VRYGHIDSPDDYSDERVYTVTVTNDGTMSDSPLVGTWYSKADGFHGYTLYYWSFDANNRFACYVAGFEPPQGGGSIPSSTSEFYMQGSYRENGNTIECYDIQADSYFEFGGDGKYFWERDPVLLAGMLLATPLRDSEPADDFSFEFEFKSPGSLRIINDRGIFPDQYDMDFEYVSSPNDH